MVEISAVRPAGRVRRWHLVAALATAATALTACSSSSKPPVLTGPTTVTDQGAISWTEPPVDMHVRTFDDRGLAGPHYTLGLSWVATGPELDKRDAGKLGVDPVRAPDGKELIVAAVSPKATHAAFKPSRPIPVAALADGGETLLPGLPLRDSEPGLAHDSRLILISAAPHSPVKLRATDGGRDQVIDLRTGATSGQQYWQRDGKSVTWKGDSPITLPSSSPLFGSGKLSPSPPLSTRPGADLATLGDYQDGKWAAPGQAYLTVPLPELLCSPTTCLLDTHGGAAATADDSRLFSFTPDHGKAIPAVAGKRRMPLSMIIGTDVSAVVFRVPDTVTSGTVTLDLGRARLALGHGRTASWVRAPRPIKAGVTIPN